MRAELDKSPVLTLLEVIVPLTSVFPLVLKLFPNISAELERDPVDRIFPLVVKLPANNPPEPDNEPESLMFPLVLTLPPKTSPEADKKDEFLIEPVASIMPLVLIFVPKRPCDDDTAPLT